MTWFISKPTSAEDSDTPQPTDDPTTPELQQRQRPPTL